MKVPKGYFDVAVLWERTYDAWGEAAVNMSLEHGVLVELKIEIENDNKKIISNRYSFFRSDEVVRLFFVVMGKEFEGLSDLRKALKNKAFM